MSETIVYFNEVFQDQRLRDAKITNEKKQKVLRSIWTRLMSDDEVYKIKEVDFKENFNQLFFQRLEIPEIGVKVLVILPYQKYS